MLGHNHFGAMITPDSQSLAQTSLSNTWRRFRPAPSREQRYPVVAVFVALPGGRGVRRSELTISLLSVRRCTALRCETHKERATGFSDPGNGESNPGQHESCPIRGDDPGRYESGEVASLCARPGRPVQCAGQVVVIVFPRSPEGLASPTMRCYPRSRCYVYLDAPVRRMHYVTVT